MRSSRSRTTAFHSYTNDDDGVGGWHLFLCLTLFVRRFFLRVCVCLRVAEVFWFTGHVTHAEVILLLFTRCLCLCVCCDIVVVVYFFGVRDTHRRDARDSASRQTYIRTHKILVCGFDVIRGAGGGQGDTLTSQSREIGHLTHSRQAVSVLYTHFHVYTLRTNMHSFTIV